MLVTHKCNHKIEHSETFGRGQARLARIAKIESTLCPACHLLLLENKSKKLTHFDGTPYTSDEQKIALARWIKKYM